MSTEPNKSEKEFKPFTTGTFKAKLDHKTDANGKPDIANVPEGTKEDPKYRIRFMLTSGPDAGRRITWRGSLKTDKSKAYCRRTMKAAGWDGTKPHAMQPWTAPDDMTVVIAADVVPAKGDMPERTFYNVKFVNSSLDGGPAGVERKEMAESDRESVLDALCDETPAAASTNGKGSFAAEKPADEDLPF